MFTRSRSATGTLASIVTQSGPIGDLRWVDVAASPSGVTQLIWVDGDDASVRARVAPTITSGNVFGATHRVSPASDDAIIADLAVDGSGNGRIVWYVESRRDIRTRVHGLERSSWRGGNRLDGRRRCQLLCSAGRDAAQR